MGYYHRAGKAVKANIVAAVTTIVFIAGVRVGLVRRVRFDPSCEAAVAAVFDDWPKCQQKRLLVVDAGIATQEQFAAATEQDAFPDYDRPLLIGTVARELTTPEIPLSYSHRSPVETNFFVAQDRLAMEMPRAWTENAIKRRIGLALLAGCLLKALAAVCEPIATGPWDKKPQPTAGRLSHYLNIRVNDLAALTLKGVKLRNYRKIPKPQPIKDLPLLDAA